jgi:hypothetical protein
MTSHMRKCHTFTPSLGAGARRPHYFFQDVAQQARGRRHAAYRRRISAQQRQIKRSLQHLDSARHHRVLDTPEAGCAEARLLRMPSNVLCHSINSNWTVAALEKRDSRMRVQFCFIAVMYLPCRSPPHRENSEKVRHLQQGSSARAPGDLVLVVGADAVDNEAQVVAVRVTGGGSGSIASLAAPRVSEGHCNARRG